MIPVAQAPEPATFDTIVRQPGLSAIDELVGREPRLGRPGRRRKKIANQEQEIPAVKFPPYWRRVIPEMLDAYESRCAYLAMYIHHATGSPTVDHALPKSYAWHHVYEWANYRLCAAIINSKKGELRTLADPFAIGLGWFALNLNTLCVEKGPEAPKAEGSRIDATLPVLNQRQCVKAREEYVDRYQLGPGMGGIDLAYLEICAPFIASELRRQGRLVRGDV
ncbi:MAG: hypothetical protein HQL57_03255 [Magnetococcales bacterium]|nr:hypothetical protein [Magnetococcales bacterium]MBF0156187.1 hypothetical protein [Magnetococcales bacterium]